MIQKTSDEIADQIRRYTDTWRRLLVEIRGCSSDQARRWAEPLLRGHPELTLHEPPSHWIAPALVPAEVVATLDPASVGQLHGEIQFALDQGDSFWDPQSDDEFRKARHRVEAVLGQYLTRVPAGALAGLFPTGWPRPEAFELGIRLLTRLWPTSTVSDPLRGIDFGRHGKVPFAKASRLLIEGAKGKAHVWWNAFGLNIVIVTAEPEQGVSVLEELRRNFDLNRSRGVPKPKVAA